MDQVPCTKFTLPGQVLKTIHSRPLTFVLSTPLVLFGARLSMRFAESVWIENVDSNSFLKQRWLDQPVDDLDSFASQITEYVKTNRTGKLPYPMFSSDLQESDWLIHFSPRHKRRLYKVIFGLSRKELQSIRNIHAFLEQSCDFASQSPRIIQHVNPDMFYDQPHLNHTFRKMTGLSPVEYFQASSLLQDNLMSASYNFWQDDSRSYREFHGVCCRAQKGGRKKGVRCLDNNGYQYQRGILKFL